MPAYRFYLDRPLQEGAEGPLAPKEARHVSVMRLAEGEQIELINGKNQVAIATLTTVSAKKVEVEIKSVRQGMAKRREFVLYQALCESARLDLLLQKTTELGVSEIKLFPAERSPKKALSDHQKERMDALLISAIKQCGRLDLPILSFMGPIAAWQLPQEPLFFGDTSPQTPLLLSCLKEEKRVGFVVGPPSGFTEKEVEELTKRGALGVKLNEHILRSETAAITAVSLGMHI